MQSISNEITIKVNDKCLWLNECDCLLSLEHNFARTTVVNKTKMQKNNQLRGRIPNIGPLWLEAIAPIQIPADEMAQTIPSHVRYCFKFSIYKIIIKNKTRGIRNAPICPLTAFDIKIADTMHVKISDDKLNFNFNSLDTMPCKAQGNVELQLLLPPRAKLYRFLPLLPRQTSKLPTYVHCI